MAILKGAKRCLAGALLFILSASKEWAVAGAVTVYGRGLYDARTVDVYRNGYSGAEYLPLGGVLSMALYAGLALWLFLVLRDRTFTPVPKWLIWGAFALSAFAIYKLFSSAALAGIGNRESGLLLTFAGFLGIVGTLLLLSGALAFKSSSVKTA